MAEKKKKQEEKNMGPLMDWDFSVYHLPELTEEEKQKAKERGERWAKMTDEEWLDLVYPNRKRDKEK